MTIVYDNIVFDNVEDLVKYKQLIGEIKTEEPKVLILSKTKKDKPHIVIDKGEKYGRNKQKWTRSQVNAVRALADDKVVYVEDLTELAKTLGRTVEGVRTKANRLGYTVKLKKYNKYNSWSDEETKLLKQYYTENKMSAEKIAEELNRTFSSVVNKLNRLKVPIRRNSTIRKKYMIRSRPLKVKVFDEQRKSLATKATKPVEITEMPTIYPLANEALPVLEKMLINMVANKGTINKFEAESALQLVDGFVWDGKTWRLFCEQFFLNIPTIAKVLNIKPKQLTIDRSSGYHLIKFVG